PSMPAVTTLTPATSGCSTNRPLPRPPAWICAFSTTTGFPLSSTMGRTASTASSTVCATCPMGTAIPRRCINCLAWYSWIFKIDLRDAAAWAALAGSPSITGARARPARADTDRHRPAAAHDRETYLGYRVGPVAALGRRVGGGTPGSDRRRPLGPVA